MEDTVPIKPEMNPATPSLTRVTGTRAPLKDTATAHQHQKGEDDIHTRPGERLRITASAMMPGINPGKINLTLPTSRTLLSRTPTKALRES